jgi:predicted amidohydrolase
MIVACCQLDIVWEDKVATFERVAALVEQAPPPAGSLLLLPEMFSTGFSMAVERVHEGTARESEGFLATLARERRLTLLGGVVTRGTDGRGRNEAVAIDPEGHEVARYTKLHPFSYGGEARHYAPGNAVVTFDWSGCTVAPLICYDLRFPEAFRAAVRRGAQLFAVIANWPAEREAHWIALLRARAIENQAYVAGVNRCGRDPRLSYSGRSLIVDPRGEIVADAGGGPGVIQATVDLEDLLAYRRSFPALSDMRGDLAGTGSS